MVAVILLMASSWQSANPFDHVPKKIIIASGTSSYAVAEILEEEGVISSSRNFVLMARILGISQQIKAGEYAIPPSFSLWQIMMTLKGGKVVPQKQIVVTFSEGSSIYKMGEILRSANYLQADQFQALVKEGITADLRQKYWDIFKYIPSESLEGYLYPDTYYFFIESYPEALADKMLQRFSFVVLPFWLRAKKDTRYNLHEILTLASIIEKEAKVPAERPVISSVFHNRLKLGMPLAADPTIKYALENPTKKVYLKQLEVQSLYNTYKRRGLPPGPICNPGIDSIKAAVYPAKTNYFYFVARQDGSHHFSATWKEHQSAKEGR